LIHWRERRKGLRDRRKLARRVQRAVIAILACVHDHRAAAADIDAGAAAADELADNRIRVQ
jgi:hypothetical protein